MDGEEELSPAVAAPDDAMLLVFAALAQRFQQQQHQQAAHSFTWFRTTLPLVCTRWQRLVLNTPALWGCCIVSPAAEGQAVKARRGPRQQQQQQPPQPHLGHSVPGVEALPGSSPVRGGGYYASHSTHPHHAYLERTHSDSSTPNRGSSPVLGSSPESDSGSYWLSQYAPTPPGASPRHISQRLSRLSATRQQRVSLSAHAVVTWLRRHAVAAGGIRALHIDLSHHAGAHDFDGASLASLVQQLPQLARVHMAGAVEGTDAYEPLARLRQLRDVELSSASPPCLDGGLLALCFLRHLTALAVSLDIAPAFPMALADLPTSLQQLRLGAMWLDEMPRQLAECTGLTKVVLERCQVEANPLPLLLTLPRLASIALRTASPGSSNASLPVLLPMRRPQQQPQQAARSSRRSSTGASGTAATVTLADSSNSGSSSGSSSGFVNTSITSLSLVDVGLAQLPACVSQLVALQELQLALNHDLGLSPATCLPQELTCLSGLQALCLGSCSLSQLPPVVAALTSLTRLELQGNALSEAGFSGSSSVLGFSPSLRVLDLTAQGSGRVRMRGIPGWVGLCTALTELRLGCSCLGAEGSGGGSSTPSGLAAAAGGGGSDGQLRGMHRSSSDVCTTDARHQRRQQSPARHGPPRAVRSLGLGSASSAPPSVAPGSPPQPLLVSPRAGPGVASSSTSSTGGPGAQTATLQLQKLPALLPELQLLVVEGGQWEQRAVRDALQLGGAVTGAALAADRHLLLVVSECAAGLPGDAAEWGLCAQPPTE